MNLTDEILFFLSNNPGNYKQLRTRLTHQLRNKETSKKFSLKEQRAKEGSFRSLLSQLKKRGYIVNDNGLWKITKLGQIKKNRSARVPHGKYNVNHKSKRKIIIAFDIPEVKKNSRYWLRIELLNLSFEMMQKSVWIGPAPLPTEFIDSLKKGGLYRYLRFFEVKESEVV